MNLKVQKRHVRVAVIVLLIAGLAAAGLAAGGYFGYKNIFVSASAKVSVKENTAKVVRGDISVTISGTGTVQPVARYDIVPLVRGNVLSAPFEEGMEVKAGELLYRIDDSDLSYSIEKSQNSVEKLRLSNQATQDSIKNLEVFAPFSGIISNFACIEGDQLGANAKVADLTDDKSLKIFAPFDNVREKNASVGQRVRVTLDQSQNTEMGTIRFVGNVPKATDNGVTLCELEIGFDSTYAVTDGALLTIELFEGNGRKTGQIPGKASYSKKQSIVAQTSGTVKKVLVRNDEYVRAGQKLLVLENDTLMSTSTKNNLDIRDSQLSLDAQKKQLLDYNITSPIDGKVIKKYYKAGDTITNSGNSSTILMTVGDMSKMIFNIDVDELDIAKVALKQEVTVTADALPGEKFTGEVTIVAIEGKTSNGVTTYPVQVTISNPGKLKPGMNVNAKILVENKKNVLYVPVASVTKSGGKAYVSVKDDGTKTAKPDVSGAVPAGQNPSDNSQDRQQRGNQEGQQGNGNQRQGSGQRQSGSGQSSVNGQQPGSQGQNASARAKTAASATNGFQQREVVVGINNDSSIEIVKGLNEGDTVYLPSISSNKTTNTNNGGFPGGGGIRIPR